MTLPFMRTGQPDFEARFAELLEKLSLEHGLTAPAEEGREPPGEVVRRIIRDVRARGDAALLEYTERFDGCALTAETLRVSDGEIEQAAERCAGEFMEALELAAGRIRRFQEHILLKDPELLTEGGRRLGLRQTPVDSAGLCVPGGAASLASTVLMTAVPAKVAGVGRVVVATPPRADGSVSDDRLAAAAVAGVDEVYRMGGAQAVAALAYGTPGVRPVDFIAGPGNIYVTLAKKEVFGRVGIEMLPGPSEVVIIADRSAPADYVAADMVAQAEHNPGASILLTDSEELASELPEALERQFVSLPHAGASRACLQQYGAMILCRSAEQCVELTNRLAPEHLEVLTQDPEATLDGVRHAGAVFLGPWSPTAVGDYVAGPSHTLPTAATARFSSGLTANDFLKRSSVIVYGRQALEEDAAALRALASAEGLDAHARSVDVRLEEDEREGR